MRLEINSGGLDSFFNGVSSFISSASNAINSDKLIGSIQNVADKTNSISGGVGTLGTALGYIQARKVVEENRKEAVQTVKNKTDNFIQTAIRVDNDVAASVKISQESFYQTNPWLRPPTPSSNWDRFWSGVGGTISVCWNKIVDFYEGLSMVIHTGGLALASMLTAGLTAIEVFAATVETVAVAFNIGASILDIIDTWGEMDNPAFNLATANGPLAMQPQGSLQDTIDLALDPNWGNIASKIASIKLPVWNTIHTEFNGLVGGGVQVFLPKEAISWMKFY